MMNNKNYKSTIFCGLVYIVGMLSVSIANIFGNHYGFVALLVISLSALYAYNLFEGELQLKKNFVNISLCGFILLSELVFFIVNDIFNVSVYSMGYTTFWSVFVIISQVASICGIIYLLINMVFENRQASIEIIEQNSKMNDQKEIIEEETQVFNTEEEKIVKFISNSNVNQKTPFMEEEK